MGIAQNVSTGHERSTTPQPGLRDLVIERWPVNRLIPYARNARTHTDKQVAEVAASIVEFGWTNPILAGGDGVIIAGHARLAAARKLGMTEVPVIVLDHLTPTQRRALVLADNRLAMSAGWDEEMLRVELESLKEDAFDLEVVGFTNAELDEILAGPEELNYGLTDQDAVPEEQETAITVVGDVWLLGEHRLCCGDATVLSDVEKLLAGGLADMVFTDPPYGVAVASRVGTRGVSSAEARSLGTSKIATDEMTVPALTDFCGWLSETCWRPAARARVGTSRRRTAPWGWRSRWLSGSSTFGSTPWCG